MNKFDGLGISITDLMNNIQLEEAPDHRQVEAPEHRSEFPILLLPEWLQKLVKEYSESYGTPPELWAVAFLSGIAAAAGKRIYLTTGNYKNYPQLWLMVVGSSGTGKSEAFRVAFRRLSEIDVQRYAKYQEDYKEWELNEKQGHPPHWEQLLINDTTPEALFNVLTHSDNGLSLYRDELSGWFSDFGRYNKSGEVGHYLSIFSNQTFSVNRKKEQPQLITEPFLNIVGTIQPSVLSELLDKNNFDESGFAQRFLFLYPEFPPRKYKRSKAKPSTEFYDKVIDTIVSLTGTDEMRLSNDAENLYEDFFNEMEKNRSQSNDFWATVYSKAQIQVLRLALVVKIANLIDERDIDISEADMEAAIGMMRYFIQSLEKFKIEQKEPTTKKEVIKQIFIENPQANQHEVARMLGVSQQYISKVLKNL